MKTQIVKSADGKLESLFIYARKSNIRIVEIDASISLDPLLSGVFLLSIPQSLIVNKKLEFPCKHTETSRFIWLSLSNVSRMAEIIAADLKRLAPEHEKQIVENLLDLKKQVFALKLEFEDIIGEITTLDLLSLASEFAYLTSDLNIQTVETLVKENAVWTKDDIKILRKTIVENEIKVVIHKWQPTKEVADAIRKAGARFVILNLADPGLKKGRKLDSDGYLTIMRGNLERLAEGFKGN